MKDFSINKLVLYNFQWQALRTSLDFTTIESTKQSLEKLENYLKDKKDINKVWRVLNLLCSVRMGFSGSNKLIQSEEKLKQNKIKDEIVKIKREQLSKVYANLKNIQSLVADTEDQIKEDIKNASDKDLSRVYKSLFHRYKKSNYSKHRKELGWYLGLIKTSNNYL